MDANEIVVVEYLCPLTVYTIYSRRIVRHSHSEYLLYSCWSACFMLLLSEQFYYFVDHIASGFW